MIYHVEPERVSLRKRVARIVLFAALAALGTCMVHLLWPSSKPKRTNIEDYLVGEVIVVGTAFLFDSVRPGYDLEVTDEIIRTRRGFGVGGHTVRRGRIRYLREYGGNLFRESALFMSEHGGIFRFLFGYVSVPATHPQYEQIKATAMTWTEIV